MYPLKWTDEWVQNPDMRTVRVHRIPYYGQAESKISEEWTELVRKAGFNHDRNV